jgi:hypothetical protein
MMKKATLLALAAFLAGMLAGATAYGWSLWSKRDGKAAQPVWTEVAWPFPIDQWGKGKAFRCNASDCGADVSVYVRAKIGFCNCTTGVSDDAELDRISDVDLFGRPASPVAPGREITVAWMKGRSRPFQIGDRRSGHSALSIGFNDRCDAIVATTTVGNDKATSIEPVVLEFLNSRTVIGWAEVTLGL